MFLVFALSLDILSFPIPSLHTIKHSLLKCRTYTFVFKNSCPIFHVFSISSPAFFTLSFMYFSSPLLFGNVCQTYLHFFICFISLPFHIHLLFPSLPPPFPNSTILDISGLSVFFSYQNIFPFFASYLATLLHSTISIMIIKFIIINTTPNSASLLFWPFVQNHFHNFHREQI